MKKLIFSLLMLVLFCYARATTMSATYEITYNQATCLYEARMHVAGTPQPQDYFLGPSGFCIVVPSSVPDDVIFPVTAVNPPTAAWSDNSPVFDITTFDGVKDYHKFATTGAAFSPGTLVDGANILLFTFSLPAGTVCANGVRMFANTPGHAGASPTPDANPPGLTYDNSCQTLLQPREKYSGDLPGGITLPVPAVTSSYAFLCSSAGELHLSATGTTALGCGTLTYNWSGPGNFVSGQQNPVVTPYTAPGTYTVTVHDANGCTSVSDVVLTAPYQVISATTAATSASCSGCADGTATAFPSGGTPGYGYVWSTSPAQFTGVATGLIAGTYTVTITDAAGCVITAGAMVTETAGNVKISGHVTYGNAQLIPMNGVTVRLHNSSDELIGTTTTITNPANSQPGYFAFSNIQNGVYKLTGTYNGPWGGNNATDALLVQMNIVGALSPPLSGLNEVVADVNASTTVSGLDALYIKLRTVGSLTSYPAGDWKFSEKTVTLSGPPVGQELTGLCTGDVNGSYELVGLKSAGSLSVIEDGVITAGIGEPFLYHIRSGRDAGVGAITLFLGYDRDRFEVMDIASAGEQMKYVIGDGHVSIAWADTKGMEVKTDELVLSLTMRVRQQLQEPSRVFDIRDGSELADLSARPFDSYGLKMAGVMTPGNSGDITLCNYPNPCSGTTTIVYSLPQGGHVQLVLTDLYGKTIRTLADREEKQGTHTVAVDPSALNMMPGMYLYKLVFRSATDAHEKINKMVFTR